MSWTEKEILLATAGRVVQQGKHRNFAKIVIDSGKVERGAVFVALKGERFDGHDFLKDAVHRGAACLLVHRAVPHAEFKGAAVIRVTDTLKALGDLAHYRREIVAPKVLAITGSNGKTTTKEMVAAILEQASIYGRPLRGKVLKTEGNYNNLVGLPLTLLRLRRNEAAAVLEMGTSRPGEIRRLTEIAAPDVGLITSIAPAHLEGLRTVAGVAREKGDLFRGIKPGGVAVVNLDDPWVRRLGEKFPGKRITYGTSGEVRAESSNALDAGGMVFTLRVRRRRRRIHLKLFGEHNVSNAVAAAAVAYGLGVDLEAMCRGLEEVTPHPMRMVTELWKGIGIINDAYNANPASMEAALRTLSQIPARGERMAVLGDMLELGNQTKKSHLTLGRQVAQYQIDRLYLLGKQAEQVKKGALAAGMDERRVMIGRNHAAIAKMMHEHVKRGDWLLFKGSRGMEMEKALAAFKEMGE
jgi:UDP-N-acetylmuramoyl-tripeptide--D-alanyl-D-alanine ligase